MARRWAAKVLEIVDVRVQGNAMICVCGALILVLALAGCGVFKIGFGEDPPATVRNVARERSVDPSRAATLINAHRAARGLSPLTVSASLNAIAANTARELARRDKLKTELHTVAGLQRRMDKARFGASRAAENLGAGYPTLAMAVEGWKKSSQHNRNLLNGEMTHMGIGLALTDKGQFKSYWVLLLAVPDRNS